MPSPYLTHVLDLFEGLRETPTGWLAHCPSPTHGTDGTDSNPSLRITIGERGKILIACRTGCPLPKVLGALGLHTQDLFCPPDQDPAEPLAAAVTGDVDHATRTAVYTELLRACGELSALQNNDLQKRGLFPDEIISGSYRTFTASQRVPLVRHLLTKYSRDSLLLVPGFIEGADNTVQIAYDVSGLVVPIRNLAGQIIALKTRRPAGKTPKYLLWSCRECPAGNPLHVPIHISGSRDTIRITEGELKADVATARTGLLTISSPGVTAWKDVFTLLKEIPTLRTVLVAFDWPDVCKKQEICNQVLEFLKQLALHGYQVGIETWPLEYKGIDDALATGAPITRLVDDAAFAKVHSVWADLAGLSKPNVVLEEPIELFPLEVFPPGLQAFVSSIAQCLKAAPDFAACGCLAVAARAIGTSRCIKLEGEWRETASLFMALVAPPSSAKTPSLKRVMRPIRRMQKKDYNRYKEESKNYRRYNKELKNYRKVPDGEAPAEAAPPEPITHLWSSDITVEAIASCLSVNAEKRRRDPALLIHRDEFLAWVRSLNAYRGRGADKEFFLSAWSGESLKVDRKTQEESIVVDGPVLAILGGLTPDMLAHLSPDGANEDGFIPRLLFAFPREEPVYRPGGPDFDLLASRHWGVSVRRLFSLAPKVRAAYQVQPGTLSLLPDATTAWHIWLNERADEQEAPDFWPALRGFYGKLRAYMARFMLVIHLLRRVYAEPDVHPRKIDVETVRRAALLAKYFTSHYRRVLRHMPLGPADRAIQEFCDWVRVKHKGKVRLRQIYRGQHFGCKGKKDAELLCRKAEDRGFGRFILEKDDAGRDRDTFYLSKISGSEEE